MEVSSQPHPLVRERALGAHWIEAAWVLETLLMFWRRENFLVPAGNWTPDHLGHSLNTVPTILSQMAHGNSSWHLVCHKYHAFRGWQIIILDWPKSATLCEFNANANLQVQFDTFSCTLNLKILPTWCLNQDPNTKFKACNSNTACKNACDDKIQTTSLSSSQILQKDWFSYISCWK
jgi:hypothetical protein